MKKYLTTLSLLIFIIISACAPDKNISAENTVQGSRQQPEADETRTVSGTLKNGLRILSADNADSGSSYTVYRGDYIAFTLNSKDPVKLLIPSLNVDIDIPFPSDFPYIKMKDTGKLEISIAGKPGFINVIDYTGENYFETDAAGADELIKNISPLILDVRTQGEYESGHIKNALLIPVQELSGSLDKLEEYRNEKILIYCASGNRSTVAANILIEAGFENIYNMRNGIGEWIRKGLPVVRE